MQQITQQDLVLINDLGARTYTGLSLSTNSTEIERTNFTGIKVKLRNIAQYFSNKYNLSYGPFETSVSSGNPMTRANKLNNVWSGLYKGAPNKQYAAQISFVMDKRNACLNVGFYFGRASGHSLNAVQRIELESILTNLGTSLSDAIMHNNTFKTNYNSLFDFGFTAYSNGVAVLPSNWCQAIRTDAKNSQITAKIYANDFETIENSTIDFYISQVIFLMAAINLPNVVPTIPIVKPLSPEQRAKRAERNAQIGLEGELFILKNESKKLQDLGINRIEYPKHVALESTHYGYDILSLDNNGNEIFIEVKTTTRKVDDPFSRKFFITNNELSVYEQNSLQYKLHRVYDIENTPSFEELNIVNMKLEPDGYTISY
jgi:hypothetical protein